MPFRSLPRTDTAHLEALETAQRKLDTLEPGDARSLSREGGERRRIQDLPGDRAEAVT